MGTLVPVPQAFAVLFVLAHVCALRIGVLFLPLLLGLCLFVNVRRSGASPGQSD